MLKKPWPYFNSLLSADMFPVNCYLKPFDSFVLFSLTVSLILDD